MRLRAFGIVLLGALSAGCATYSQMYVNADGAIERCSSTGQGIYGMATASDATDQCGRDMRAAGFLELSRAGTLGIIPADTKVGEPVRILRVQPESPAEFFALLPGDVITKIDGVEIASVRDATRLLFGESGTRVDIELQRKDQTLSYTISREPYSRVFGRPSPAGARGR